MLPGVAKGPKSARAWKQSLWPGLGPTAGSEGGAAGVPPSISSIKSAGGGASISSSAGAPESKVATFATCTQLSALCRCGCKSLQHMLLAWQMASSIWDQQELMKGTEATSNTHVRPSNKHHFVIIMSLGYSATTMCQVQYQCGFLRARTAFTTVKRNGKWFEHCW